MDVKLVPFILQEEIAAAVQHLAKQIDDDYVGRSPIVIGVLKGSFIFLADLIRAMRIPIRNVELIRLASYGTGTTSSGNVKVLMDLPAGLITGQDVLLVEDIVDTGRSTATAIQLLKAQNPASVRLCALLDKPERRQVEVTIDYLGITIPDRFIVGYGTDMNEQYRQLPAIYTIEELED